MKKLVSMKTNKLIKLFFTFVVLISILFMNSCSQPEKKSSENAEKPKLKLGLFSYSYHLAFGRHADYKPTVKMDLFQFMDRAKEMGFDGIQIDITHLESHDSAYLAKLTKYAEDKGFYIEYGSTGIEEGHTLSELEVARQLHAPIMRTYMGFSRYDKKTDVKKEIEKAISVLNNLKPKLKEYGIKLAIENHCDATADELLQIIKRVNDPNIGVCVDLGNFMINLENPTESVEKLAPYIVTTHFKDYNSTMMNWGFKTYGVALGDGAIDLNAILKILTEKSKLDRIMLEIPIEPEGDEAATLKKENDAVEKSALYARNVLGIK